MRLHDGTYGDPICDEAYVSGWKRGRPCPFRASAIVMTSDTPFLVCGYHARQFSPRAVYPFDWNLQRLRRWRLRNLLGLTGA